MAMVVILAAVCGLWIWNFNQPPFPLVLMNQLPEGTHQDEVHRVLGPPANAAVGGTTWTYAQTSAWPLVIVRFDAEHRLLDWEYDY